MAKEKAKVQVDEEDVGETVVFMVDIKAPSKNKNSKSKKKNKKRN